MFYSSPTSKVKKNVLIHMKFFLNMYREFCSLFEDECSMLSCDNKCKIPCGGGVSAINRLNTLSRKFFTSSDMPNFSDHDLRTGHLITPEGNYRYKRL